MIGQIVTYPERCGWTQLSVGCHWTRGPYTVSTYRIGAESGYAIFRDRQELARVSDWPDVEAFIEHVGEMPKGKER